MHRARSNDTAFFTVFYPGAEDFFHDFASSLVKQTVKDFDLVFINDGMPDMEGYLAQYPPLNWVEINESGSPEKIREKGLIALKSQGYNIIVLGDADDVFADTRVDVSRNLLKSYDIVVNDLTPFNSRGIIAKKWFSNRLENETKIDLNFILDKNIFGLSNTAFNAECIDSDMSIREDTVATDWLIFFDMLRKGCNAVFTNSTETLYRQHTENVAGLGKITKTYVSRGVTAKRVILEKLLKDHPEYLENYKHFKKREIEIKDRSYMDKYIKQAKKKRH